jgi:hypothetical protein
MLVDLLPPGVKRENPLLRDSSLSTPQSNISRYATFSYWIKSWLTLLPSEIDFQHRLQMNLSLPPTQPSDDLTQGPTLGVVGVMNSARDSRPPDATTSRAEQVLMVLGSDPVDKQATDGPPLRSEANNVSITGSPLNSIKTQAIHSPPVPCSLDPLPSPASQATGVFPLNSEMSAKIETHKNKITLQTSTDHPSCSLICVCGTPTRPIQTPRTPVILLIASVSKYNSSTWAQLLLLESIKQLLAVSNSH